MCLKGKAYSALNSASVSSKKEESLSGGFGKWSLEESMSLKGSLKELLNWTVERST